MKNEPNKKTPADKKNTPKTVKGLRVRTGAKGLMLGGLVNNVIFGTGGRERR
jgi:hypothetical protein